MNWLDLLKETAPGGEGTAHTVTNSKQYREGLVEVNCNVVKCFSTSCCFMIVIVINIDIEPLKIIIINVFCSTICPVCKLEVISVC